jgi:nucleolar protein 12
VAEQEKNERSVFVGNLPVSTIQKENYRDLKKTFAEYGEIESIRFRSIVSIVPSKQ